MKLDSNHAETNFSDVDGWTVSLEFNNVRSSREEALPTRFLLTYMEQVGITPTTRGNMLVVLLDRWSSTAPVLSRMTLVSSRQSPDCQS